MAKILCYDTDKIYYLCMEDGVHQVKVLSGDAWLHFNGYCFQEPRLEYCNVMVRVAGKKDNVSTRCKLWNSYEEAAANPQCLAKYDVYGNMPDVDAPMLWQEVMKRNTWFSAPKTLNTTNGVHNYNPQSWYWNGVQAKCVSVLESFTTSGNDRGLHIDLDTLEVISGTYEAKKYKLYPTKEACEAENKCPLFTFDDENVEEPSKEERIVEECSMGGLLEEALKFIPESKREAFLNACLEREDA